MPPPEPRVPIYNTKGDLLCGATKRSSGEKKERCRRPAGWGTDHLGYETCKLHGGSTPNMGKKAANVQADELVDKVRRELLVDTDALPVTDPFAKLQQIAGGLASALDNITNQVNELASVESTSYGPNGGSTDSIAVKVALWERITKMLSGLLVDMAKLGIADRQARLNEQQGMLVVQLLQGIFADLQLSAAQQALIPDVVPRHLRMISGELEK